MKKLLMILLAALIFLPSAVTAFAADAVSFALDTVKCRKNRLVDIEMTAECNTKLSAAMFSFSYDKSVLEFREATAPDGSKVVTNETDDRVRLSYLCEKGASVKDGGVIFTLEFKAVEEGSSPIDFTASECVDPDAQWLSIGECVSGEIIVGYDESDDPESSPESSGGGDDTYSGKSSSAGGKTYPGSEKSSVSAKSESGKKSKAKISESSGSKTQSSSGSKGKPVDSQRATEANAAAAEKTSNGKIQKDHDTVVPIAVLCVSCVTAAGFFGYVAYRIISERKAKKDPNVPKD